MHGCVLCGSQKKIWECGLFWIELYDSLLPKKQLLPEQQSLEHRLPLDTALEYSCQFSESYFETQVWLAS